MWKYFLLGLLVGWLLEWIVDWFFWRRPGERLAPGTPLASRLASQSAPAAVESDAIEPNAGTSTSADTSAGRVAADVAVGAAGAVSTSSATITTRAPVYRQEDLEAIAGIGPKIGAMLRNNGITTFAELAATPVAELIRIVESTGEQVALAGIEAWPAQARLAAAGDWAGFSANGGIQPDAPAGAGSARKPSSTPSAAAPDT